MNSFSRTNKVDISVCMAVKNCSKYVSNSISSILKQDINCNCELLVCDDGSEDNTIQVAIDIIQRTKSNIMVSVYSDEESIGCGPRRNCLISKATGKFIATADGDDIYPINRVREQYSKCLLNDNIFSISGSGRIIDDFGENIGDIKREKMESLEILESLKNTYENPIVDPCSFFNKEIFVELGGYSSNAFFKLIPDLDLWMRFFEFKAHGGFKNKEISVFPDIWVDYRKNPNGNTIKFSREMMKSHGLRRKMFIERLANKKSLSEKQNFTCTGRMKLIYEQNK